MDLHTEEECKGEWLEFTCKYPKENQKYSGLKIVHTKGTLKGTIKNSWEIKDRFSLFHDTRRKEVKVVIRQFESGKYECRFIPKKDSSEEDTQNPKKIFGKKSSTITTQVLC